MLLIAGVKQNYARKHRIPIDAITFNFSCLPPGSEEQAAPQDGAVVHGMFIEGARWDADAGQLAESLPKVSRQELRSCDVITALLSPVAAESVRVAWAACIASYVNSGGVQKMCAPGRP